MPQLTAFIFFTLLFTGSLFAKDGLLKSIQENNELKVCVWPEYFGISYLNPQTQKLEGIDSDLAMLLAKDLEVNLTFVQSSFATLIDDVTNEKCHIAMFAIGNTKSRREKIRFTTPHLSSDIYAITTKSNQKVKNWDDIDKKGVVVAVAKGTYHEPVMKAKLKQAKLLVVNSMHAREQEVQAGRADVFMTDYPFAKRMLAQRTWAKLIVPKQTYHKTPYAWAMKYDNEAFYNAVETFLQTIKKDGRLLKAAEDNSLVPIAKLN